MNSGLLPISISIISIVISITNFIIPFRWNVKQGKSNTYERIRGRLFELNKIEVEHPDLFKSLDDETSNDSRKQDGQGHYLFMFFSLYEEVFVQHRKFRMIDNDEYQEWEKRLSDNLSIRKGVRSYWNKHYSNEARPDFKTYIDKLISDLPSGSFQSLDSTGV